MRRYRPQSSQRPFTCTSTAFLREGPGSPLGADDADRDRRKALDVAAVGADEVWVIRPVTAGLPFLAAYLEAPHVVPQIRPGDDALVGEVHQVAVDRRPVKAVAAERFGDLTVAERGCCALKVREDSEPARGRTAEPVAA